MLTDLGVGFAALANGDNTNHALSLLSYYAFDMLLFKKSWVTESLICPSQPVKEEDIENKSYGEQSSDVAEFAGSYQHPFIGTITFT